ncbi:hypothetical protein A4R35_10885 [Thermogemmatispora tikiterensis]|uniref:Uncharacterized protein n=1 Tax=Thermogemmatispora tikiterensis TaxID=1825093 RepID=A0A328VJT3_9CHLR|nr:hypothetical protein A4R35_10885 [Thermogemmatispora tikiterensis]
MPVVHTSIHQGRMILCCVHVVTLSGMESDEPVCAVASCYLWPVGTRWLVRESRSSRVGRLELRRECRTGMFHE